MKILYASSNPVNTVHKKYPDASVQMKPLLQLKIHEQTDVWQRCQKLIIIIPVLKNIRLKTRSNVH